jgi:hypothetical protein
MAECLEAIGIISKGSSSAYRPTNFDPIERTALTALTVP